MKHPHHWLRWLFLACALFVLAEYAALTWFAPRYAIRAAQRLVGDEFAIEEAQLFLPLATRLGGIRHRRNAPEAALTIGRAFIRPKRLWFWPRVVEIDAVEIERLFVRVSRTASGTWRWPAVSTPRALRPPVGSGWLSRVSSTLFGHWQLQINTLKIIDGAVELIDERTTPAFHALLDHVTVNAGPLLVPENGEGQVSLAVRGLFSGEQGSLAAPAYCSGWVALGAKALHVSCQLEPLPLAVFDPYWRNSREAIRVYSATLASTSQWIVRADQLQAKVQLELGRLDEGDISVRGRNILDIKRLAAPGERRLTAEISLTGPFSDPAQWQGQVIPGNAPSQELLNILLERNIKVVTVPFGAQKVGLRLAPASEAAIQDMQAVSKDISEALEILAAPLGYPVSPDVPTPLVAPVRSQPISPSTQFFPVAAPPVSPATAPPSQ